MLFDADNFQFVETVFFYMDNGQYVHENIDTSRLLFCCQGNEDNSGKMA